LKIFTKASLKDELRAIRSRGWIETRRKGNDGGVGNTLEDLLGISENNLPLPNAGEWEVKGQRKDSQSLVTLFHMEPSPRAVKFVPRVLLPNYGWRHQQAGSRYPDGERSFRQTITAGKRTSRGFTVIVNRDEECLEVSFNASSVNAVKHGRWLQGVIKRTGSGELDPQPCWGFQDLFHKAGTKLTKTVYAIAERKRQNKTEYFRYSEFLMLEDFSLQRFMDALERGEVLVDFDARTGHNHGTKFMLRQNAYRSLYARVHQVSQVRKQEI